METLTCHIDDSSPVQYLVLVPASQSLDVNSVRDDVMYAQTAINQARIETENHCKSAIEKQTTKTDDSTYLMQKFI